jgi:uncharacterized repeat protein (TIGR03803 family)
VSVAYGVLYNFEGGGGDGYYPYAGLTNIKGTFYSTTQDGGVNFEGAVFSVTPSGTETMLHSFGGSGDGTYPFAGLINVHGTLYGTTETGGANSKGTVFSITPSGAETVLHSFGGSGDGAYPCAGLLDVKGTLYSTTNVGGANNLGTIFSITPSGTETVVYSFKGGSGDGEYPFVGSLINVRGKLYDMTVNGGTNNEGTVFSVTPSGKEKVLHSFKGGSGDGELPYADLVNVKGTLYGTTYAGGSGSCSGYSSSEGCGTVFSITRSGRETLLYSFKGGSGDGEFPEAGVINVKGTLYGTTMQGGGTGCGGPGCGTLFAMTPSGTETVLHNFTGSGDGQHPIADVLNVRGTLYSTTYQGGTGTGCTTGDNGCGTVFSLRP